MSFRNLEKGDQFVADYNKYKAWKALDSEQRQTKYEALNVNRFVYEKENIYVNPFGVSGNTFFVTCSGPKISQAPPTPDLLTLLANRFERDVPVGPTQSIIRRGHFPVSNLAKLTLKLLATRATAKSNSRITGNKYYRHQTNSATMSFGKSSATDTFEAAVTNIKSNAKFDDFNDKKGNAIIIIPEKAL